MKDAGRSPSYFLFGLIAKLNVSFTKSIAYLKEGAQWLERDNGTETTTVNDNRRGRATKDNAADQDIRTVGKHDLY